MNYQERTQILADKYEELSCYEFYRIMYPTGSFSREGHKEDRKPNGIIRLINENKYNEDVLVFDELHQLDRAMNHPKALMSGCAYSGKAINKKNAYVLHAYIFDIDDVEEDDLNKLLFKIDEKIIPRPTMITSSGSGVHLTYVLDEPEPMQLYKRDALDGLKRGLTQLFWEGAEKKQTYQGLYQAYRMPGSLTKNGHVVRAFKSGDVISIAELNDYVEDEYQASFAVKYTLEEARKLFPGWFENLDKSKPSGSWFADRKLYLWWISNVLVNTRKGNRFWCISMLFVYAKKCGIVYETVYSDALELVSYLNNIAPEHPFSAEDVESASTWYSDRAFSLRRETVEMLTGITMPLPSKRYDDDRKRKRKKGDATAIGQKCVLEERAWPVRDALYPDGSWRANGRPPGVSKERDLIAQWKREHYGEDKYTRKRCAEELGLSKNTVGRWWNDDAWAEPEPAEYNNPLEEAFDFIKKTDQVSLTEDEVKQLRQQYDAIDISDTEALKNEIRKRKSPKLLK